MSMHFAVPLAYLLAVVLLLAATVLAIRYASSRSMSARLSRPVLAAWCGILSVTGLLSWHFNQADPRPQPTDRPIEVNEDDFVSSRNCRSCHRRQYETWHASYHRTMTQLATPETVIGEFDGRFLERDGYEFGVQRDGDRFMVTLLDDLGRPTTRPVVMTTGFHHMQVYWFSTGNSRMLGHFPFVYLRDEQRWISSDASFLHPQQHGMTHSQLTNVALWNHTCLKCHVTNPKSLIQDAPGQGMSMDTQMAELGIACEACHGPGEDHVTANQNPLHRYSQRFHDEPDSTITHPGRLDHRKASQVCGICHSITNMGGGEGEILWRERGNTFRPGDEIADHRKIVSFAADPELLEEMARLNPNYLADRFWDDGMVRVSGREFNGLLETRCYTHGEMSCLSCHTLHPPEDDPRPLSEWADDQLKMGMRGNQACLQCHDQELGSEQQLTAHTHHPAASSGSLCYNCHMPYTTYGLQKAIRSHQVDSPSVQSSVETGRPNACNLCHLDKTMAWAADGLDRWYDIARPQLQEDQQQVAASVLWLLSGDAGQRALMAWAMGWQPAREVSGDNWMVPYLGQLLLDPYGAVRFIAARSLRRLEGYKNIDYDFELPVEKREAALERIRHQWSQEPGSTGDRGSVLLDESGQLDWDLFRRLLGNRDDRRINLAE